MPNTPTHPHDRSTDQIFENITVRSVAKVILGAASMIVAIGVIAGSLTYFLATKSELKELKDSTSVNRIITDQRLIRLEETTVASKAALDVILRLQSASATVQCLQLERDNSLALARASRLRCDTLVAR